MKDRFPAVVRPRATTRLRTLLSEQKTLLVPGCYDALTARLLERAGFSAVYMTGYGTCLALTGLPDVGLTTMTEMHLNARYIANAVSVPVIADADNGYGNAISVMRTTREYIQTGAAGIHLEDQVLPKSGHDGRRVIAIEEAVGKLRAADRVRQEVDPDFLLIGRTDARTALGGSLDEAILRANAYLEAGADMAFIEGLASVPEVERVCKEVNGPKMYNLSGKAPRLSMEQMEKLGISVAIMSGVVFRATMRAIYDLATQLRIEGPLAEVAFEEVFREHPLADYHEFSGLTEIRALEREFIPSVTSG